MWKNPESIFDRVLFSSILVKPENLAGSELGNALLSLASLGGLTGFPNFMQGGSNPSSSSPLNLTSQRGSPHGSQMSPGQGGFPFPGSLGSGPMPQLILASGQISQGIQGAQLLIPTSQGMKIGKIPTTMHLKSLVFEWGNLHVNKLVGRNRWQ